MTAPASPPVYTCAHPGCSAYGCLGFGPPLVPKQVWYCGRDHVPDSLKLGAGGPEAAVYAVSFPSPVPGYSEALPGGRKQGKLL